VKARRLEDPEVLVQRLFLAVAQPMGLDFFVHSQYPAVGSSWTWPLRRESQTITCLPREAWS
jgi:hypothetical protein